MTATDSRLRRRGNRLRAERELEKEQREAVPGVMGVCGTLRPSTSSTMRKARPRARGSTICKPAHTHTHTHTVRTCWFTTTFFPFSIVKPHTTVNTQRQNSEQQGCTQHTSKLGLDRCTRFRKKAFFNTKVLNQEVLRYATFYLKQLAYKILISCLL